MEKSEGRRARGKIHLAVGALAMFLTVAALLLTSFQIAIYGDPQYRFYEKEYVKYNVTESLGMELPDVMAVTGYMMDYLIGREDELSIETDVDGKRQDFFNEQDRLHMADVRNLFLGGLRLRTVLFFRGVSPFCLAFCVKGGYGAGAFPGVRNRHGGICGGADLFGDRVCC